MINEWSDKISRWLEQDALSADKIEPIKNWIDTFWERLANATVSGTLEYFGITKNNIMHHLNNPMPDAWSETTGKVLEQLMKSLGG